MRTGGATTNAALSLTVVRFRKRGYDFCKNLRLTVRSADATMPAVWKRKCRSG